MGRAGDRLVTVGLGSCVGIVLHDGRAGVGALAHVLLPEPVPGAELANPYRFVSTAVPRLMEVTCHAGAARGRLTARLVGGAAMFPELAQPPAAGVGERNLDAARERLAALKIPLVGEDSGGAWGRTVTFEVSAGRVLVTAFAREEVTL